MPCNDFTKFRGVDHFGKPSLINQIDVNFKHFMDWAFLKIGAWNDVDSTTSGVYGGNFYELYPITDLAYEDNQVYQGVKKDWVWETGVDYVYDTGTYNPIAAQIYLNGSPISTTGVGEEHYINYPAGKVIFDSPLSDSDEVTADYSYRSVQVYISDSIPWWFEVQYDTDNPADLQWASHITSGGDYSMNSEQRVQLPAVIIETVSRGNSAGFEIGNLNARIFQDVLFHVIAENKYERDNITDIIRMQKDKTIWLYDIDKIQQNDLWPLNYNGMLNSGALNYNDIINNTGLLYNQCYIKDLYVGEIKTQHPKLFMSVARATLEVIL